MGLSDNEITVNILRKMVDDESFVGDAPFTREQLEQVRLIAIEEIRKVEEEYDSFEEEIPFNLDERQG